jgi:flagellin
LTSSIGTNSAALAAAQALRAASDKLQTTQQRMATGLAVAGARDNAATFAIAQNMRAELNGWQAATDSLNRGQSLLEVASAGMARIADLLGQLRKAAFAYNDPSMDMAGRAILKANMQDLVTRIDNTAKTVEFEGKKPLADTLVPVTVTTTATTYSPATSPLTPPALASGIQNTSGAASQTFSRDAGPTPGRIDLYLDAYGVPDVLEIWQGANRVAATGQAYVPGGAPVGPGAPVSGQTVLSFDYDPALGQQIEFRFNETYPAAGSVWDVGGVALQDPGVTPPPGSTTVVTTTTGTVSTPTSYSFVRSAKGDLEDIAAQAMTASALGLDVIDWNDPAPILGVVDLAISKSIQAEQYFGERSNTFAAIQKSAAKLTDAIQTGVGNMVDADLGREAAKLQADQVRQQLAVQTLSIANASPNWLLSLFKTGPGGGQA